MSTLSSTLSSSAFLLLIKLVHRSIGIISMLVLARLLTPEDFGIVAIASMVVFLCDILTETGSQQYIVNKERLDREDLDTSFTLNFILKLGISIVVFIASPILAKFFEEPNLESVFRVIILLLPFSALSNPGVNLYKRDLNYQPLVKVAIYEKIFSFVVVMAIAVAYRNYWAMIFGVLASYTFKTISTYFIHDYRPRFSLTRVSEQWGFSKWMLLKGIVGYSKSELDTLLVSKFFSFDIVGGFSLMKNLSTMTAREIIQPATEPLLAAFSKVKNNPFELSYQIEKSILILFLFTIPIAGYLSGFSDVIVKALFDSRWWKYAPILGLMSILMVNFSLVSVFHHALTAVGKIRFLFYYDVIGLTLLLVVLVFGDFSSIVEFSAIRVLVSVGTVVPLVVFTFLRFKLSILGLFIPMFTIVGSVLLSFVFGKLLLLHIDGFNQFIQFLISGTVYVVLYGGIVWVLFAVLPFQSTKAFYNFLMKLITSGLKSILNKFH